MNCKGDVVKFHPRYRPIPKPFYVVACGDHCMVCTLTDGGDLIEEVSAIHWNKWTVRRWAFVFEKETR